MATVEQLKKIYFPIAEAWRLIRKYADATGTLVECFKAQEEAELILEKAGKTKFAEEILSAAVNEIGRIMEENKVEGHETKKAKKRT